MNKNSRLAFSCKKIFSFFQKSSLIGYQFFLLQFLVIPATYAQSQVEEKDSEEVVESVAKAVKNLQQEAESITVVSDTTDTGETSDTLYESDILAEEDSVFNVTNEDFSQLFNIFGPEKVQKFIDQFFNMPSWILWASIIIIPLLFFLPIILVIALIIYLITRKRKPNQPVQQVYTSSQREQTPFTPEQQLANLYAERDQLIVRIAVTGACCIVFFYLEYTWLPCILFIYLCYNLAHWFINKKAIKKNQQDNHLL